MKNKKMIFIIPILVILLASILLVKGSASYDNTLDLITNINYNESLLELNNPERGFYEPIGINMQISNNKTLNPKNNLVHLRVGIGAFSSKVNGEKDLAFTDDMLNALDTTLKNIKKNGGSVIIRFAYDNFNGTKDLEPTLDMILTHIKQLKKLFNDNVDVIAYVELGFFGPWGEMHSSKICTKENVSIALDTMLDSVPQNITIGVRTPAYYAAWTHLDQNKLNEIITEKDDKAYRVGLYNDGYLGSESDLGTFKNRDVEVSWLNNQAKHTFYGGEVVANYAVNTPLNTIDYISKEGFLTHTTYLNLRWNNTVIDSWKNSIYNGEDELYKGLSAFAFINNHLGYRFVLRKSMLTTNVEKSSHLQGKLNIENVGFANLINEKKVTIILKKGEEITEIKTNLDPTTWESNKVSEVDFNISLPKDISLGKWDVYLRISKFGDLENDNNYQSISFANENIFDEYLGANYIGSINILETKTTTSSKTTPSISSSTKTTTTKPIISNDNKDDILYVAPDEYPDNKLPTTTTSKVTTTTKRITTTKINKKTTTSKKTTTKSTSQNKTTTTTSTSKSINEEKHEEEIIKEYNNSKNIKGLVVLFLIAVILILIFITNKKL